MDGITVFTAIVGSLIILGLLFKVSLLNSRLQGYREAQPHIINGGTVADGGGGCLRVFAIIGFVAFLGLCVYIGIVLASAG